MTCHDHTIFPTSYALLNLLSTRGFTVGVVDPECDATKDWCRAQLDREHSLGAGRPAGRQLWQVIRRDSDQAIVALCIWAASALHLKPRDEWIGWDNRTRESRLGLIVGNSRLLILEASRERNVASQALGAALRTLPAQWQALHGYLPVLAEGFTDIETHHGTTYKVTNWKPLGTSKGFKRHNADFYQFSDRPKKLWVRELCTDARDILCSPQLGPTHAPAQIAPAYSRSPLSQPQALSLREVLRQIPDPRRSSHTFKMSSMLTIVIMALLAGEKSFNGIVRFMRSLSPNLRRDLGLPLKKGTKVYRVPSYNCLREAVSRLDPDEINRQFSAWVQAHQGTLPRTLAVDGKDLGAGMGHLISLVLVGGDEAGIPVAMRVVDAGHEQAAALSILNDPEINLNGALVSADALHCQHKQSQDIRARGGEFILSVKNNQPSAFAHTVDTLSGRLPLFAPR